MAASGLQLLTQDQTPMIPAKISFMATLAMEQSVLSVIHIIKAVIPYVVSENKINSINTKNKIFYFKNQ